MGKSLRIPKEIAEIAMSFLMQRLAMAEYTGFKARDVASGHRQRTQPRIEGNAKTLFGLTENLRR